eukprot:SAG25_NODE_21_length_22373_cov_13.904373_13_plen_85_part_00
MPRRFGSREIEALETPGQVAKVHQLGDGSSRAPGHLGAVAGAGGFAEAPEDSTSRTVGDSQSLALVVSLICYGAVRGSAPPRNR